MLRAARRLAEKVREADAAAGILVAAAAVSAGFDSVETPQLMRDAVKAFNRARGGNLEGFSVLRRVDLTCRGGDDSWYGVAERIGRVGLFDALAALAKSNVEETVLLAEGLEDPATRIRALASVVKTVSRTTMTNKATTNKTQPAPTP